MSMYGADIAALRSLAWSLRRANQHIEATRQRLAATIEALPWEGPDSDRFLDEWRQVHQPALATVATETVNASSQASRAAYRQEHASRRDR